MVAACISPLDIQAALTEVGVKPGSVVFVHSDAMIAAALPPMTRKERLKCVVDSLEAAVAPGGTVVMPTFTYSFTSGLPFDVATSEGRVGLIPEFFRRQNSVCRSEDPIFSVAAHGLLQDAIAGLWTDDCFGPASVFGLMRKWNAHIVCIGCAFSRVTFVHHVERMHGVSYRYEKSFSGTVIGSDGVETNRSICYYVRDLQRRSDTNLERLEKRLTSNGSLLVRTLNRVAVLGVSANDFFSTAWAMLDEDETALIEEGACRK